MCSLFKTRHNTSYILPGLLQFLNMEYGKSNVPALRDLQELKLPNSLILDSCGENVMPVTVRTVQGSVQADRQDHSQMVTLHYSQFNKFLSAAAALKVKLVKSLYQHFCNFCVCILVFCFCCVA